MIKHIDLKTQIVWCLIALMVLMSTVSQFYSLHTHIHHSHSHHGDTHSHSHSHGRFDLSNDIHQQSGIELEVSQQLIISKAQPDSLVFIVYAVLLLFCLRAQAQQPLVKRKTERLQSYFSIPPPARAPPQVTV
jgi:hypothetical protein